MNGPAQLIALARPSVAPMRQVSWDLQRHGLAVQNDNTDETVERLQRAVESAFSQMYEYVRAGGGYSTLGRSQAEHGRRCPGAHVVAD